MAKTQAKDYTVRRRGAPAHAATALGYLTSSRSLLRAPLQTLTAAQAKSHTMSSLATIYKTSERGIKARAAITGFSRSFCARLTRRSLQMAMGKRGISATKDMIKKDADSKWVEI